MSTESTSTPARAGGGHPLREWPLLVVAIGVVAGLLIAFTGQWRIGVAIVGIGLGIGALERLLLPDRVAGLLRVRSRAFDVTALAVMAVGVVISAIWVRGA
ncbi:MAG: DUF3017 domain-containing protein [Propionibacteriales bacterium]|nr:DUF3017 domain-containing protein [Propionibacteriales bacterium]